MKHETTQALHAYWNALRAERVAPFRSELDPRAIAPLLANTFILETAPHAAPRFRLAGTRLCAQFGMELRGMSALSLWHGDGRREMRALLDQVIEAPAVGHAACTVETRGGHLFPAEFLFLPLYSDTGELNRILGCGCYMARQEGVGRGDLGQQALGQEDSGPNANGRDEDGQDDLGAHAAALARIRSPDAGMATPGFGGDGVAADADAEPMHHWVDETRLITISRSDDGAPPAPPSQPTERGERPLFGARATDRAGPAGVRIGPRTLSELVHDLSDADARVDRARSRKRRGGRGVGASGRDVRAARDGLRGGRKRPFLYAIEGGAPSLSAIDRLVKERAADATPARDRAAHLRLVEDTEENA